MAEAALTAFIVDDDAAVRDSLSLVLSLKGYRTATYASAEDFLAALRPGFAGCVIADIRMPGLSGLELQQELARRGVNLPVVIVTAHGDVASARAAFRADAVDFLEKPFDDDAVVRAIDAAFMRQGESLAARRDEAERTRAMAMLTERERDVLPLLLQGMHHRDVGQRLGISPRTVEIHKAHIMAKTAARNLADLIRLFGLD
jgi:FixJ family two-component response regulator